MFDKSEIGRENRGHNVDTNPFSMEFSVSASLKFKDAFQLRYSSVTA